jgi:hypothetical protein
MGPPRQTENIDNIMAELKVIAAKLTHLDLMSARLEKLEQMLKETAGENKKLKEDLCVRDAEIPQLKARLNTVEKYYRSWSIRINELLGGQGEGSRQQHSLCAGTARERPHPGEKGPSQACHRQVPEQI